MAAVEGRGALAQEGISAAVVNAPFRQAVRYESIIEIWRRTCAGLITVEEGSRSEGLAPRCLEALSEEGITHLRTKLLGLPDWYIEQGPQDFLRERYGLTEEGIYNGVKALLELVWPQMTPLDWRHWSEACRMGMSRAASRPGLTKEQTRREIHAHHTEERRGRFKQVGEDRRRCADFGPVHVFDRYARCDSDNRSDPSTGGRRLRDHSCRRAR